MVQLAENDLLIDYHTGLEAVIPGALSCRPNYGDCEGSLGNLLPSTVLTLEARCSTLFVKPC